MVLGEQSSCRPTSSVVSRAFSRNSRSCLPNWNRGNVGLWALDTAHLQLLKTSVSVTGVLRKRGLGKRLPCSTQVDDSVLPRETCTCILETSDRTSPGGRSVVFEDDMLLLEGA